jgi:hypothetical protein
MKCLIKQSEYLVLFGLLLVLHIRQNLKKNAGR